jgi:hypothetical protein
MTHQAKARLASQDSRSPPKLPRAIIVPRMCLTNLSVHGAASRPGLKAPRLFWRTDALGRRDEPAGPSGKDGDNGLAAAIVLRP